MAIHELLIIPEIFKPLEPLVCWEGGFSDEDVEEIISLGELFEFEQGKIGGTPGNDDAQENPVVRQTDITWIQPCDLSVWLYRRMTELCSKINDDKFQFDITNFQPFQYGKYKIHGHYDWHTDSGPNMIEHRKLSFVVGLSDPDSYEGGELEINDGGNPNNTQLIKIKKGHVIVFPSYIPHRVKPVTSGERLTLVGWAVGPKFK